MASLSDPTMRGAVGRAALTLGASLAMSQTRTLRTIGCAGNRRDSTLVAACAISGPASRHALLIDDSLTMRALALSPYCVRSSRSIGSHPARAGDRLDDSRRVCP